MSAAKRTAAPVNDNSTNQPSSQTFTIPPSCVAGDFVVFGMSQNTGVNEFTGAPGWDPVTTGELRSGSNMTTQLWQKKLVAGEPNTAVTFTSSGGGRMTAGYLVVSGSKNLSDVKKATPTTGTTADPFATPTVTTTETDNYIAEIVFVRSALATQVTLAPGAGLTEDAECNTNFASSPNFAMGIYHPANSGAVGAYGGHSVDANQAITGSHRYILAFPSASVTPDPSADVGMRVRIVKEDGSLISVHVYAVLADGSLKEVSDPD